MNRAIRKWKQKKLQKEKQNNEECIDSSDSGGCYSSNCICYWLLLNDAMAEKEQSGSHMLRS